MTRWVRGALLGSLCSIAACGLLGETKTQETVRGRLTFVQTATATGTYGDQKSYSISNGDFRFSGRRQWALGTYVLCHPSPNEAREAFVCQRLDGGRERVDVVSVVGDRPRAVNIYDGDLARSTGLPEWTGDREGRWVIFEDVLYDVQSGEKRSIENAPGSSHADFRGASPDAETVVYQLSCMSALAESDAEKRMEALCAEADAQKLDVLWLVQARTGAVEIRKLPHAEREGLDGLVWEPDARGKLQLVAPRPDER